MGQSSKPELDLEKFRDEIDSLKRMNKQFMALRSWAVNICLASFAFLITTFVQIRLNGPMPQEWLAKIAFVSLALAAVAAIYMRVCHEFSNLASDTMQLGSFVPKLIELAASSDASAKERGVLKRLLDSIAAKQANLEASEEISPYAELWRFMAAAVFFAVGLGSFLLYLFIYFSS